MSAKLNENSDTGIPVVNVESIAEMIGDIATLLKIPTNEVDIPLRIREAFETNDEKMIRLHKRAQRRVH